MLVGKLVGGKGVLQWKEKRVFCFCIFPVILHARHPAISEYPLKLEFGDCERNISLIP